MPRGDRTGLLAVKVILHIGDGKAGSTSTQDTLYGSRDALLARSILVPTRNNLQLQPGHLARMFWDGAESPETAALWHHIDDQITATRPEIVFLSSEYLWRFPDAVPQVAQILGRWTDEVQLIAYLREPRSFYRSTLQQILKASAEFPSPFDWVVDYAARYRGWEAGFGARLTVLPYEPARLKDGSVVRDIAARTCPAALTAGLLDHGPANVADCAEVTQLVQDYLAENHPDAPRAFRPEVDALRDGLAQIARTLGIDTRPALTDAAAETILALCATDLRTLRSEFGFVFSDIDYDGLDRLRPDEALRDVRRFSDVCPVDPAIKQRLLMTFLARHLTPSA